ncbi:hypothetical protein [Spiroplasma culicicola]|uniref:Uncharacterized protein n=1 Tax=Spiroplasma culicicola AES-1 TaxID=1276246 RepID=W6A6Z9_9MOLU|nr:hypothetical protein [Spiroplasma culicicola]AHI52913.1 hypothetical protein SCULI_v1c05720 [Spiroplasma culicicola AES-1]
MRQVQDKNYFLNKLLKDREINQLLEGQSQKNINGFIDNLKEIKKILHIKEQTDKKILEEYNKLIVIPSGSEETLIRELHQFNKAMYDWPDYYTLDFGVKNATGQTEKQFKPEIEDSVAKRMAQSERLLAQKQGKHRQKIEQEAEQLNSVEKRKMLAQQLEEDTIDSEELATAFSEMIVNAKQNLETNLLKAQDEQNKLLTKLAFEFERDSIDKAMKLLDTPNFEEEGLWSPGQKDKKGDLEVANQNNESPENEEDYFDIDIEDEEYYQKRFKYENNLKEVEFEADHSWNKNELNSFEANSAAAYLSRINNFDPSQSLKNGEQKIFRTKLANLPLDFNEPLEELDILLDENNLPIEFEKEKIYFDLINQAVENWNSKQKEVFKTSEKQNVKKGEAIKLPKNILGLSQPYIHESTTEFEPTLENIKELDSENVKRLSDEELTMVTEIWERDPIDPLRYDDLSDFEKRLISAPIKTKDLKKGEWLSEIHDEIMEKDNSILKDAQEIIVDSEEEKLEQLSDIKNNLDEGNYGKLNLSKPMAITCARYMKKLNYLKKGFEKSYGSELFKKIRDWIAQENLMYENAERNNRIRKLKTKRFKTQKSVLQKQRLKEIFKVKK